MRLLHALRIPSLVKGFFYPSSQSRVCQILAFFVRARTCHPEMSWRDMGKLSRMRDKRQPTVGIIFNTCSMRIRAENALAVHLYATCASGPVVSVRPLASPLPSARYSTPNVENRTAGKDANGLCLQVST
ncbi:hypothetical protein CABS01_01458 [Colletotrichum abscissum]|uniref:Uncharacterized protein n=1 Tax=Colletotrichum cuscutae TaxID=1209917 RepID=A0AAI9U019_9PEZI|nr:uncharacterized protein CABS01_01458 [Colletotrichum abscissum]KAK1448001.1 hypothetical protein CCUS01_12076 [Colletotrichum cuscutae]KAK1495651.1 hypothetical protein CABS01_01458 [Colletotrichum abscissum]